MRIRFQLLLLGLLAISGYGNACAEPEIEISERTFEAGPAMVVRADEKITTTGIVVIADNADVRFQASNQIVLSPGFSAQAGGYFSAQVDGDFKAKNITNYTEKVVEIAGETFAAGLPLVIRASERITSIGAVAVSAGADVTFQAGDRIDLFSGFTAQVGSAFKAKITKNKAQFIRQIVPLQLTPGQSATVSIIMRNTGVTSWTKALSVRLGSQSLEDNTTWMTTSRVTLSSSEVILPGQNKIFSFDITAPLVAGTYPFQWMMVQEGIEWFGGPSPLLNIVVGATSSVDSDGDGLPDSYTIDTNGDGVPDAVEMILGLDPNLPQPDAAVRSKAYNYDARSRLTDGPGRSYDLDAESNIKGTQ